MAESRTAPVAGNDISMADIASVVRGVVPTSHRALLFGSRATGCASERSDWDIGVIGPRPIGGAVLERLREALERMPTLRTFDVVDLATAPVALRERALSEGLALV